MVATQLDLASVSDERGTLVTADAGQLGVPIKRMFQVFDVPAGLTRGGHAHRTCHQFLIASVGTIDVGVHDGVDLTTYRLDDPAQALHVPPGVWASQTYVTNGAVLTVLASHPYEESDYIRVFAEFLATVATEDTRHA